MSNQNLKQKYEKIYKDGKRDFFSRFENDIDISETDKVVWNAVEWKNKNVIDIGCGTGETALGIARLGAKSVTGIDYSKNAIKKANSRHQEKNLKFEVKSFQDVAIKNLNYYDVVISCGTLEHMDNPAGSLKSMLEILNNNGTLILTCPYFINLRGIVWMTLALSLNIPMSLTDKHFISPFDIRDWLKDSDFQLSETLYFDFERANSNSMIIDMEKRLNNAFKDSNLPTEQLPKLIKWLKKIVEEEPESIESLNGSSALYLVNRRVG